MTRGKRFQSGWAVLIHPQSSAELATVHVYFVRSFQIFLLERNLYSLEDCRRHLEEFSAAKDNNVGGPWNGEIICKVAEGSGTKRGGRCLVALLGDNEKCAWHHLSG